jgi:hypothetical protein
MKSENLSDGPLTAASELSNFISLLPELDAPDNHALAKVVGRMRCHTEMSNHGPLQGGQRDVTLKT